MNRKPTLPEPERWCDRPDRSASGTTAENRIGAAFRRVRQATEPSAVALDRLARRIDRPSRSTTTTAQLIWRVALATALVMAMGGAVGAALKKWRHATTASGQAPTSDSTVAPSRNAHARRGQRVATAMGDSSVATTASTAESTTAPLVTTPPVPEIAELPSAKPAATANAYRSIHPSVHPSVHPSSGAAGLPREARAAGETTGEANSEARLLADAFRELRSGGDAGSALRSLDQYDGRFPNGALRNEARIARAEALMILDRRAEALPLIEGIEEHDGALTRNVRITRGELFAETGRCANAIRDFNAVLAATEADTAGGRALYGRASCHLLARDIAAARRDLKRYLLLHPDGSLATAARHALDSLP
jgi:hypothetical protein